MPYIENIIIGAGPAGLQLGYFFQKNNDEYLIIEKDDCCGSFFKKYPHSKKLISINKVNTGSINKDFNLRHDWNSLLNEEDFLFSQYSKEFYPCSLDLYNYINDFQKKFNINVSFNNHVIHINKTNNQYEIILADNETYNCKNLNIAIRVINPGFIKTPLTDKNKFKMPMIIPVEKAADILYKKIVFSKKFEINCPWLFCFIMKILRILPYSLYLKLTHLLIKRL